MQLNDKMRCPNMQGFLISACDFVGQGLSDWHETYIT